MLRVPEEDGPGGESPGRGRCHSYVSTQLFSYRFIVESFGVLDKPLVISGSGCLPKSATKALELRRWCITGRKGSNTNFFLWASWACGHGDANTGLRGAVLVGQGLTWAVGLHQQLQPSRTAPEPEQNQGRAAWGHGFGGMWARMGRGKGHCCETLAGAVRIERPCGSEFLF